MSTTVAIGGVPIISMPDLGAFNDTSSVVGERAGSGRFSAASVQAYMGAGCITQTPTGFLFAQNGARINRLTDRLFVGPAALNDGAWPNITQDWLEQFLLSSVGGGEVGLTVVSTMNVLSIGGQTAFVAGTRTSDNPAADQANTIGIASWAINDNTTLQSNAWAYYGEARRLAGINETLTVCCEFDVSNQDAYVAPNPYGQYPGGTAGISVASGCGLALPGTQDTTVGIELQGNPTKFGTGLLFAANAIRGTDGTTGFGTAISFAKGHAMVWYNAAGVQTSIINSSVSDPAKITALAFSDNGFTVQAGTGEPSLIIPPVANVANYVVITGAPTGGEPGILAGGDDANVDLVLHAKGGGALNLSGPVTSFATAGGAAAPPATPGGYLTVKLSGTAVKIPYYL